MQGVMIKSIRRYLRGIVPCMNVNDAFGVVSKWAGVFFSRSSVFFSRLFFFLGGMQLSLLKKKVNGERR